MPQSFSTARPMPWRFNPYPPRIVQPNKRSRLERTFTYDRIPSPSPTFLPYAARKQNWTPCLAPKFEISQSDLDESEDEKIWSTNQPDYHDSPASQTRSSMEDETTAGSITWGRDEKFDGDYDVWSRAKLIDKQNYDIVFNDRLNVAEVKVPTTVGSITYAKEEKYDAGYGVASRAKMIYDNCRTEFNDGLKVAGAKVPITENVHALPESNSNLRENDEMLPQDNVENKPEREVMWGDKNLNSKKNDSVENSSTRNQLRAAKMELLLLGLADRCSSMDARALDLLTVSLENFSIAVQRMEREQSL